MNKGTLIILSGLPGSGKSTFAENLKDKRNAIFLWPDYWTDALVIDKNDIAERTRVREIIKKLLFDLTEKLLLVGTTVIIERGFWKKREREVYKELAKKTDAQVELYFFDIQFDVLWHRIEMRNKDLHKGAFPIRKDELEKWHSILEVPDTTELQEYDNWEIIKQ